MIGLGREWVSETSRVCSAEQTPHEVAAANPVRELTKSLNIFRRNEQPSFFLGKLAGMCDRQSHVSANEVVRAEDNA
jgi:hypothetical protein